MSASLNFPFRLTNFFVVAYAVDAAVSLIVLATLSAGKASPILEMKQALSSIVVLSAILCMFLLPFCARLPMPSLLVLCMSVFWLMTGAAPLPLTFAPDAGLPTVLALLQSFFAIAILVRIRLLNGGSHWLLNTETRPGPTFSLAHSLRFAASLAFIVTPLLAAYFCISLATWLELATAEFVSVDFSGIQLADRLYSSEAREIRLVGMMHLGADATYRELAESFVAEDTIVLEEGVSDVTGALLSPISYDQLAHSLGLQTQRSVADYLSAQAVDGTPRVWPVIRNADVDASVFSPETLSFLQLATGIWASDSPGTAFLSLYRDTLEHPEHAKHFVYDVIERRNGHLLGQIEQALRIYDRIIVPWGALHLPEIEREIVAQGFVLEGETRRQVVAWKTLLRSFYGAVHRSKNQSSAESSTSEVENHG